jgi:DeoR/GlpR family transcriptional regulator of sugar metabolism
MERAGETASLVTADKLGAASPYRIAPLSALSALIVSKTIDPQVWPGQGPKVLRA